MTQPSYSKLKKAKECDSKRVGESVRTAIRASATHDKRAQFDKLEKREKSKR